MSEESITELIKVSNKTLSNKFEIIENLTLDNSKTSVKDCFDDFFAKNQGQSEE